MIQYFTALRQTTTRTRLMTGVGLLGLSALLLASHAGAVRAMRDTGLPAAVELPALEQRMRILKEQNEVAELQAALSTGSAQEMLDVYVLPSGTGAVRALAALDTLFSFLQQNRELLSVSAVTVGDLRQDAEGTTVLPLTFSAHVTRDGWRKMSMFIAASGLMTVGDTISHDQFAELLSLTEQENPATVAALEQFFSVDLLRYAQDPRAFNEALLKSFSSDIALHTIRTFLDGPHLQSIRDILGPLSPTLRASRLWPLQFLQLEQTDQRLLDDGTFEVTVTVGAYGRTN
jgi:hypothetical protein